MSQQVDILWQHSDNVFRTAVRGFDGELTANTDYSEAEYLIADRAGNILFAATIGAGITRDGGGNDFITKIDDGALTFAGAFEHQFVVYDLDGNRLPPVFKRKVKILPTFKQES